METRRLGEQDAYATLRRRAMDQGIRIVEAARQILLAARIPDGEA
jgi:response regulator NasT